MAREKTKTRYFTMPAKLNDGLRIADVKKKVGEVSGAVFRVVAAEHNGEGVNALITHMSSILPKDGPDGPAWAANVLNSAYATSVATQADSDDLEKAQTIVPKFMKFGEVDKGQVAGARLQEFIAENGRAPSANEYKDLYAGLSL